MKRFIQIKRIVVYGECIDDRNVQIYIIYWGFVNRYILFILFNIDDRIDNFKVIKGREIIFSFIIINFKIKCVV